MASKVAAGNIAPSIFVKEDTADGKVLASGAGEIIYGISQEGSRNAPLTGRDDGYCAIAGENLRVYKNPEDKDCFLTVGGTVAPGDKLKADASGFGVATTSANDNIGAVAEENGTVGMLIRVMPLPPGTKL